MSTGPDGGLQLVGACRGASPLAWWLTRRLLPSARAGGQRREVGEGTQTGRGTWRGLCSQVTCSCVWKTIKNPHRRSLELIGEVVRHEISTERPVVFLCTCNQLSKKETKKTVPFTIASKRIKHLGINLTKKAKDLCTKTLLKEIGDTNKWKRILCSQIEGRLCVHALVSAEHWSQDLPVLRPLTT